MAVVSSNSNGRKASLSPMRKATIGVLVAGIIAAAALALGSAWVVRIGVAVAALTAIVAVALAWHDAKIQRQAREAENLEATRAQGADLHRERQSTMAVVDSLKSRNSRISGRVSELSGVINDLRTEIADLRTENSELSSDLARTQSRVEQLRAELRLAEAELAAINEEDEAEVFAMPRRGLPQDADTWAAVPTAEELWADGDHPTVVDMEAIIFPESLEGPEQRQHA